MSEACPDRAFWHGRPTTVTGGNGFLGRALVGQLQRLGAAVCVVRSAEHDLRQAAATREALEGADVVFHLAARVGGIGFNRRSPAPLIYENLLIGANVFEQSRLARVRKLVAACSVCAYPEHTPIPFSEDDLWAGYPEESNAPYGLAKKMLLVLSDAYRRQYGFDSCAPVIANLYGPRDNFDVEDSHVVAAMTRKFVEACERDASRVVLWGSGQPSREFLYVDDAAHALILSAEKLNVSTPVNIGTGKETRIAELAAVIRELVGFEGQITWDTSMPDGQQSRCLDVSRARRLIGFEATTPLDEGLRRTIESFRQA